MSMAAFQHCTEAVLSRRREERLDWDSCSQLRSSDLPGSGQRENMDSRHLMHWSAPVCSPHMSPIRLHSSHRALSVCVILPVIRRCHYPKMETKKNRTCVAYSASFFVMTFPAPNLSATAVDVKSYADIHNI